MSDLDKLADPPEADDINAEVEAALAEETEEVVEEVHEEPPQFDERAQKATDMGWRPKDEWEGDPDAWVDADEYIRRQPLFERIHKAERESKEMQKKLDAVAEHARKVEEVTRDRTIKELEAKRRQAVEEGDMDRFDELDKEIQEVRTPAKEEPEQEELPEYVTDFARRNAWFEKDEDMTDFMLARNAKLMQQGIAPDRAIRMAEDATKQAFASKFANPNKTKGSPVAANNPEQRPQKMTYAQLNDEQKMVFASLKKTGMTFDEFAKQLEAVGG